MFNRIKLRFCDMKTISTLISGADEQARISGEDEPGAEHYLLSALNLSDGSARKVFERAGADPDKFRVAIGKQYNDALNSVGINDDPIKADPELIASTKIFHNSKPSGQAVMKALYALKQEDKDKPLVGAHVVGVVAGMDHGVAARALRAMGLDQKCIANLVKEELKSHH